MKTLQTLLAVTTLCACGLFGAEAPKVQTINELQCKAEAVAPFVGDNSEALTLAKKLVQMEKTGDISIEEFLADIGLTLIQVDLFRQAYRACETKQ